jgi:glycosyltransferase involved in cell wall biosynthesis
MRIAYLLPASGAASAADGLQLARSFVRLGHEVVVVSTLEAPADATDLDVRLVALDPVDERAVGLLADDAGAPTAKAVRALLAGAALRTGTARLLGDFRPDVVYERWAPFAVAGAAVARAADVPLIVEIGRTTGDSGPFSTTVAGLEREALEAADHVVTTSSAAVDRLRDSWPEGARVTLVPPAMEVDGYELTAPVRDALRSLLKVSDRKTVGVIADLEPGRDVAGVLKAAEVVRRRGGDAAVLVVGDGPDRSKVEELAESLEGLTVILPGAVPEEQLPAYLAAIDVAVAPSSTESPFPTRRLLQYLAAGVPVVAADSEAAAHCVREDETGLLYAPDDVDGLADALGALLADSDRAAKLGAAGREHVSSRHSWDETARRILDLVRVEEPPVTADAEAPERAGETADATAEPASSFESGAYASG